MFLRPKVDSPVELELASLFRELKHQSVDSKEYSAILDHIVTLHGLRKDEETAGVNKNTLALIGGNLLGIFMIIRHEHVNVVTSRALSLLTTPK
jgi:hypothetical protein